MIAITAPRLEIPSNCFDSRGIATLQVIGEQNHLWMTFVIARIDTDKVLCRLRERRVPQPLQWLMDWVQGECARQSNGKGRLVLRGCEPVNDPRRLHALNVRLDIRRR